MHYLLMLMFLSVSQGNEGMPENELFFDCCYQRNIPQEEPIENDEFSPVGIAEIVERVYYPAGDTFNCKVQCFAPQKSMKVVTPPG